MRCISEQFGNHHFSQTDTESTVVPDSSSDQMALEEAYAEQNRVYVRWRLITQKPINTQPKRKPQRSQLVMKFLSFF